MMALRRHPSPIELSRAATDGVSPAIERHLSHCAACVAALASFTRVDVLVRELPEPAATPDHRDQMLAAILATTARPTRRAPRGRWFVVPALIAAGAFAVAAPLVIMTVRSSSPSEHVEPEMTFRGAVRAHEGARFARESGTPDEVVRLHEGTISVDVTRLAPGARFRIVIADAEIEGSDTSFDAVAKGDTLVAVQAVRGRVDVRPTLRSVAVVIAGQRWEAETLPIRTTLVDQIPTTPDERKLPDVIATPTPTPAITTVPPPPQHAKPVADLPMARLFDLGWQQLRHGNPSGAIDTFDEGLAKYPRDPLAEDAAFWRGVALARSKRAPDAIRALSTFCDDHPSSPRAGEASAMLGWLLLAAGDTSAAERRFSAARTDHVASVRESAEKGLTAVTASRGTQP